MTWSFLSQTEADAFGGGAWSLANPISEDLKVMRPSLLPGLLSAAARNLNRGVGSVRLFELGRRYLAEGRSGPAAAEFRLAPERDPGSAAAQKGLTQTRGVGAVKPHAP